MGCVEELEPDGIDSVLVPTILGNQLNGNPYSVAVMQHASINLYGNNGGISANKKYVRFKPANELQLQQLAESNLDLFDYPLDRDVLLDGDYYPQSGFGQDDYTWLYTVVDINFLPPPGITYEVLQQIYVPDTDIWLEDEALRITGNPVTDTCGGSYSRLPQPCDDVCNPGPGCPLPPPGCGGGGGGDNPLPTDTKKPAGRIMVWDSNMGQEVPVKRTRVIARRWFKIEPVYTNDLGRFQCTKKFRNKVNILVKLLNNNITVHGLRHAKFWQMWFPIKKGIGIYTGPLNNIYYLFGQNTNQPHSRTNRNWWAAQLMNARVDHDAMAATESTGPLPTRIRVLLTGWANARGAGSAPMNWHRNGMNQFYPPEYITFYLINPQTAQQALTYDWLYNGIFLRQTDITFGYDKNWSSDRVNQLYYHEMSHAAHFNKVGQDWWNSLVCGEAYEIARFGINGAESPYDIGDDGILSGRIALAESWAEHMGRTMAHLKYGNASSDQFYQGQLYSNGSPVSGLTSHLNLLEDFSPNRTADIFRWIPYGIYYDLSDNRNDFIVAGFPLPIDNVSGYSNQKIFNALESDITSVPEYRVRLLSQNGNSQSAQVIELFGQYSY